MNRTDGMFNDSSDDVSAPSDLVLGMPYCFNSREGRIPSLGYSLAAVNLVEIVINLVHIIILHRMPSLKGTAYLVLLCYLSAADMANGVASALRYTLNYPEYFQHTTWVAVITYDILLGSLSSGRYYITTAAAIERYMALCRPMAYETSLYITRLNRWLLLLWGFSLVPYIVRDVLTSQHMCFSPMVGPVVPSAKGVGLMNDFVLYSLSAVSAAAWTRVIVELWRMRKRGVSTADRQLRRSTVYLMVVAIMFYLCFLPPFITYCLLKENVRVPSEVIYLNTLPVPSYGILNTVLYGWMNSGYRKQARQLLACRKTRAVAPGETTTTA